MLDIKLIRHEQEKVQQGVQNKNERCDLKKICEIDEQKREKLQRIEQLKFQRNQQNAAIAKAKRAGEDIAPVIEKMGEIARKIKIGDAEIAQLDEQLTKYLLRVPNMPLADVPVGGEEQNVVLRHWGAKKTYDFIPQPHWELAKKLQMLEIERAAKISGSGFVMFHAARGAAAKRPFKLDAGYANPARLLRSLPSLAG